ncbi:alpha/beta hydrolase [Amycolatopsis circi]|uniref:alpha/beta hydrolase n=1 Tax=Amycolatopsis circi TaxID=871959 RepID=UPI000E273EBC|nr:alpha/beta hydrolase [Amycolatopsis circi]
MSTVEPEIAAALAALPVIDFADPVAQRAAFQELAADPVPPDPRVSTQDHIVVRPDGSHLLVRSYRPRELSGALPAVMWFHGGGFVFGSVDVDDFYCAELAVRAGAVVLSVEYRLAPENPFPAGVEDCYLATCWAAGQPADAHWDGARLAVAGGSAGGNLAAVVALMARDRGGPQLALQVLLCPAVQGEGREPSGRVYERATSVVVPEDNPHILRHYLGSTDKPVPRYAVPSADDDLSGLPPAYVLVAGLDYLRESGAEYALALDRAGVSVELHLVPNVPHGFDAIAITAPTSRRIVAEYCGALVKALGQPATSTAALP